MPEDQPATQPRGPRQPIKLLVVDDNAEVRGALARWFSRLEDFVWMDALPGAEGLEEALVRLSPEVVLLDWDLPGVDTFELLARMTRAHPAVVFAVLSAHVQPPMIRAALRAGAAGYLTKSGSPARLAADVRLLAAGRGPIFSDDARAALMNDDPDGT